MNQLTKNAATDFAILGHLMNYMHYFGSDYMLSSNPDTLERKNVKVAVRHLMKSIKEVSKSLMALPKNELIISELKDSDTLAFGAVLLHMLGMADSQRALLEELIKELAAGNVIHIQDETQLIS